MNTPDQTALHSERSDDARLSRMVCFAVYSAGHALNRIYKPLLNKFGLTYPQYLVLIVLWERDELTVKELGERLFLDSGTLTPLLKRMETGGFIRRTRDAQDERQVRISLTASGRELEAQVSSIMEELVCASGLPEAQLLALTDEITRLRSALQAYSEPQP